jgi:hypothetical protein
MNKVETLSPEATKKEVRQIIYNRLSDALGEFKPLIKRKKFDDKMLTATKLFADDIIKSNRKTRIKSKKKNNKADNTVNGQLPDIN